MPPSSTPSDPGELLATVRRTLTEHHMLTAGDRVLVGVSGGPDSMVLLHLLNRLAPALEISLGVAHLNHCLRGACSDRDAQAVLRVTTGMRLPFHSKRARVTRVKQALGLSMEDAARRVRYAFFRKTMQDAHYNKLALGHHLDDNAEQMLMAMLRGTGPRGLSGIAPNRQNHLVRPLIQVRRSQIEAYARQEGVRWVTDASNQDLRFVRNRIRHHLLPLLASDYNPRISEQLSQLADVMRTEQEWIDELISVPYTEAIMAQKEGGLTFAVSALRRMHPALVRRLLRRALADLTGTLRRIGFTHIQAMQRLIVDDTEGKTIHLPRGIRVRRTHDQLEIKLETASRRYGGRPTTGESLAPQVIIAPPFPCTVKLEDMGIGINLFSCRLDQLPQWRDTGPGQAFFDLDRLSMPLILRSKLPGDRFKPLGADGLQKVKKYFIDHRISREERERTPILADQRQIIWLVGQRIDDRPKLTAETTRVLGAEIFLLDNR